MGFWSKLFGKAEPEPLSHAELMQAYRKAHGNAKVQWQFLRRAAAAATASGDLMHKLEVNAEINSFEQRYGRRA
jgi:hypothetical protein